METPKAGDPRHIIPQAMLLTKCNKQYVCVHPIFDGSVNKNSRRVVLKPTRSSSVLYGETSKGTGIKVVK